jgi:hypothetical protein
MGLGFVFSAFNDYLQFGVGRNMDVDTMYWFFGINLPIAELSLSKLGIGGESE